MLYPVRVRYSGPDVTTGIPFVKPIPTRAELFTTAVQVVNRPEVCQGYNCGVWVHTYTEEQGYLGGLDLTLEFFIRQSIDEAMAGVLAVLERFEAAMNEIYGSDTFSEDSRYEPAQVVLAS